MEYNNPCQHGSQLYDTPKDALRACCLNWVSAGGSNDVSTVCDMMIDPGVNALVNELLESEWRLPGGYTWKREDVEAAMVDAITQYVDEWEDVS